MSDDNDSGGIIGTIISIFILAAIWPYLLALLGIYIAYILAVAILEWITQNWLIVGMIIGGVLALYCIIRFKVAQGLWRRMTLSIRQKPVEVILGEEFQGSVNSTTRQFEPSTSLYCYWCTKKLGIKACELSGKFYCDSCRRKILDNTLNSR